MKTLRISVITPLFALGGVPLAQQRLARALASKSHNVNFAIGRIVEGYDVPSDEGFSCTVFGKSNVTAMFIPLIRYMRRYRPEVIFSAEDHLNTVVLAAALVSGCRAKISCSSRVTPYDTYSSRTWSKGWVLRICAGLVNWRAQALTCVSKDMVLQYRKIFKRCRHTHAYNIGYDAQAMERMQVPVEHRWLNDPNIITIVAAGHLQPWKGFADLIRAFRRLDRREVRMIILGDGPLRTELEDLISSYDLEGRIEITGFVDNPLSYFGKSEIFVLSSLVEGMPNVLLEAMACGCTPVATDCPTGPRELLKGGKFGYLARVGDPEDIAEAILKAIDNPIDTDRLKVALKEFSSDMVLQRHSELLDIKI